MKGTIKVFGQLEIDTERGVIYFHSANTGQTLLRICRLPTPIPHPPTLIDITHMFGTTWSGPDEPQDRSSESGN